MKNKDINCPNCGAPWNVYHRQCDYCKTHMPEPHLEKEFELLDSDPYFELGTVKFITTTTTGTYDRFTLSPSGIKVEPLKPRSVQK